MLKPVIAPEPVTLQVNTVSRDSLVIAGFALTLLSSRSTTTVSVCPSGPNPTA
jgi:hypothetical protein